MSPKLRVIAVGAVVAALVVTAALVVSGGGEVGPSPAADPAPRGGDELAPDDGELARSGVEPVALEGEGEELDGAFDAFAQAITGGRAASGAADLRRLLRSDPAALAEAFAVLLDDRTDADLRRALAMVLGTMPVDGVDDVLLAALDRFGDDGSTAVALIAALGALRDPPDDDEVFDLEAAPHFGVPGPGGMGITVRNVITDPRVEAALGRLLLDRERADVRLAAAAALQFSMDRDASRTRFLTALTFEMDDAVAGVVGEALGGWARQREGVEPARIVGVLVAAADRPGFDEYRLRLETALDGASLGDDDLGRLRGWAGPSAPFELRSWAMTVLVRQRAADPATRELLIAALDGDADAAIRDQAARLLGGLPADAGVVAALRAAFDSSAEWNVRSSSLASLVRVLPAADARALLDRAVSDPDLRIQRRAERLRARLH